MSSQPVPRSVVTGSPLRREGSSGLEEEGAGWVMTRNWTMGAGSIGLRSAVRVVDEKDDEVSADIDQRTYYQPC